jgi:hypothetical protein
MLIRARDDKWQGPKLNELHDELGKAGWTHAFCTRPGEHPLAQPDIEASLRFFKREHEGTLKPSGASFACEAGTSPGDPAADASAASASPAPEKAPPARPSKKAGKGER